MMIYMSSIPMAMESNWHNAMRQLIASIDWVLVTRDQLVRWATVDAGCEMDFNRRAAAELRRRGYRFSIPLQRWTLV